MRIENYISDLLYRYQCVTVPNLGAFLTQYRSARVHETTNAFYPPSKAISFNSQLRSDDGLLTRYIAEVKKITFEEASSEIGKVVSAWTSKMEKGEAVEMEKIGSLSHNEEGKILFQPSGEVNYLPASFGLSPFVSQAITREELKQKVVKLEQKTPIAFTPERRRSTGIWKYAAMFLLAVSSGAIGYKLVQQDYNTRLELAQRQAQETVERNIQQATFFDTTPLELPAVTLELHRTPMKYHIIAGAFRVLENAEKRVKDLNAAGYDAEIIGVNKYGLHQVSYSGFNQVEEALAYLRKIKKEESSEAWLLVN